MESTKNPPKQKAEPKKKGADLVPNLENLKREAGVTERMWFWAGSYPTSPRSCLDCGAASFPMISYEVHDIEPGQDRSERTPHLGNLLHLSKAEIESVRERMPYSIIRFEEEKDSESYVGRGTESVKRERLRRGRPLRILSPEEIKERKKNGVPAPSYTPEKGDEPLADYVFLVPVKDQDNPRCGGAYPPPLSETGLEWPEG